MTASPLPMHAVRLHAFGPAENLVYEETAAPEPGPGQVRIAVQAAGVHLIDTRVRAGEQLGPIPLPDLPAIPGREVAGTVELLGDGVDPSWRGRRVVAHLGPQGSGGYAERALADVTALHALADHVSAQAAVAAIGTGRTAIAILEIAAITADDSVLIPAAAGGLGALLVQAARAAGAHVTALAGSAEKAGRAHALGATDAYTYDDPAWHDRQATLVLDGVGGAVGRAAFERLSPGGRMLVFGWSSGEPTPLTTTDVVGRGVTLEGALGARIMSAPGGLRRLETVALQAVTDGTLTPLINPPFALAQAAQAHAALERRATAGKVVLTP